MGITVVRVLGKLVAAIAASIAASGCSGPNGDGGSSGAAGNAAAGTAGNAATSAGGAASSGGTAASSGGATGFGGKVERGGVGGTADAGTTGAAGTSTSAGTGGDGGATGDAGASGVSGATASAGSAGMAGEGGGAGGSGSVSGRGGVSGSAGGSASGGSGTGGSGGAPCGGPSGGLGGAASELPSFSFFVTSLRAMRLLSGSQDGFGGDLRFGEVGAGAGLRGADKICTTIAETSMPGSGAKGWRAFLSATTDGGGSGVVNAIDRIGNGPWYDRLGKLVAADRAALLSTRPQGDALVVNDLPNEDGIPNHTDGQPGCVRDQCPDNHDTLTGSSATGTLWNASLGMTCNDWTSAVGTTGRPMLGHSWPADSGMSWMEAHAAQGCAPGVHLNPGTLPTTPRTVGYGGGYGGIYCFALAP